MRWSEIVAAARAQTTMLVPTGVPFVVRVVLAFDDELTALRREVAILRAEVRALDARRGGA